MAMQRPTFNVTEFQDVIHVQMNHAMRRLLIDFITEVDPQDLEAELRAFRNALRDPDGALERKLQSSPRRRMGTRDGYNGGSGHHHEREAYHGGGQAEEDSPRDE